MDGEKKVRNSNNGHHLLKPWFVYISQVFSVAFTVIPPLPHFWLICFCITLITTNEPLDGSWGSTALSLANELQ